MDIITISLIFGAILGATYVIEGALRALRASFIHIVALLKNTLNLTWKCLSWCCFEFPLHMYGAFKRAISGVEKATRPKPMVILNKSKDPKGSQSKIHQQNHPQETNETHYVRCFGKVDCVTDEELKIPTAIRWKLISSPEYLDN